METAAAEVEGHRNLIFGLGVARSRAERNTDASFQVPVVSNHGILTIRNPNHRRHKIDMAFIPAYFSAVEEKRLLLQRRRCRAHRGRSRGTSGYEHRGEPSRSCLHDPVCPKFRNAVTEFAQKEIAPRAAEIDKTNTFPTVCQRPFFTSIYSLLQSTRIYGRS
jgi:hypothetical protein